MTFHAYSYCIVLYVDKQYSTLKAPLKLIYIYGSGLISHTDAPASDTNWQTKTKSR